MREEQLIVLPKRQFEAIERGRFKNKWFRFWVPYNFSKLENDRFNHVYLPLNRDYRPLGVTENVTYQDYIAQALVFMNDPAKFKDVWVPGKPLYLYDGSTESLLTLGERFMRLQMKVCRLYGRIPLTKEQEWRRILEKKRQADEKSCSEDEQNPHRS